RFEDHLDRSSRRSQVRSFKILDRLMVEPHAVRLARTAIRGTDSLFQRDDHVDALRTHMPHVVLDIAFFKVRAVPPEGSAAASRSSIEHPFSFVSLDTRWRVLRLVQSFSLSPIRASSFSSKCVIAASFAPSVVKASRPSAN